MVRPDSSVSKRSLELGRVQFIQQQFADVLAGSDSSLAGAGTDRIYWIHDRLFTDGWSVEAVRTTLIGVQRNLRVIAITNSLHASSSTSAATTAVGQALRLRSGHAIR